jgi:soluble lytic murein transglycosylase-like protein
LRIFLLVTKLSPLYLQQAMTNTRTTQGGFGTRGRGFLLFATSLSVPVLLLGPLLAFSRPSIGAAPVALPDEVAVYTPGPTVPTDETSQTLPDVLRDGDVVLYRKILEAHDAADWATADKLIGALTDRQLVGHILAHRYLQTPYKASYEELRRWLLAFMDQTEAPRLYAIAQNRKPKTGAPALPKLKQNASFARSGDEDISWRDKPYSSANPGKGWPALSAKLKRVNSADKARDALALVTAAEDTVDPVLLDQARARLAQFLFLAGQDSAALAAATTAARSAEKLPDGAWTGGLAAWRLGKKGEALGLFAQVWDSPAASEWTRAGAAFWAYRSAKATGKTVEAQQWLTRAAEAPYSYYGLIARRTLQWDISLDWELPNLTARDLISLKRFPGVTRALALTQIGLKPRAEAELRAALPRLPAELYLPMLTLAERGGSPGLAMSLAGSVLRGRGERYDAGLYPVPHWTPRQGFAVNPALLYAIARHESHFTVAAKNPSGAQGLLQIMPGTATAMARKGGTPDDAQELSDPTVNMTLGQRLASTLLRHDLVKGDLLRFAVGYSAGIGQLDKMLKGEETTKGALTAAQRDPLLFVESIPFAESRNFGKRLLANYWIYQKRLGQPTDSLTALAGGKIPTYRPGQYAPMDVAAR